MDSRSQQKAQSSAFGNQGSYSWILSGAASLARYPRHQEVNYPELALRRNLRSPRNLPPLRKAVAAAACACVLRLEDGVPVHWSLPAVVRRIRRRETRADEVLGVAPDRLHALLRNILPVGRREVEPRSELRARQPLEECAVVPQYQTFQRKSPLPGAVCTRAVRGVAASRSSVTASGRSFPFPTLRRKPTMERTCL